MRWPIKTSYHSRSAAVGKIAPTVDLSADVASRGGFRLEVEVDLDVLADERSTDLGLM
jgi:hypothetical protein